MHLTFTYRKLDIFNIILSIHSIFSIHGKSDTRNRKMIGPSKHLVLDSRHTYKYFPIQASIRILNAAKFT